MQVQQTNRTSFWYLAKALMVVWRRWCRLRRIWRDLFFRIEATASLNAFHCGNGLRIDAPVRIGIRGGALDIGNDVWLGWYAATKQGKGTILLQPRLADSVIAIGAYTQISNNVSIVALEKVSIGTHCLIGEMAWITDCNFHEIEPSKRDAGVGPIKPVNIGDNVWIGSRVMILPGVEIGNNTVIGAGSVVTRSIPSNCLAVGVPAKVIRQI